MSDSSEEECYDSDLDPEFECDNSSSESDEDEQDDVGTWVQESIKVKPKPMVLSSECEARSASPSKIHEVNLSESESDDDDDDGEPEAYNTSATNQKDETCNSDYFLGSTDTKTEGTNYDFSHIINLQNNISKAREEYSKQNVLKLGASDLHGPDAVVQDSNILELLAKCEKKTTEDVSFNESSSEEETTGKTIQIVAYPNEPKGAKAKKSKQMEKYLMDLRREKQACFHKCHLLCLIAHGNYLNTNIINDELLQGSVLSVMPKTSLDSFTYYLSYQKKLLAWFKSTFKIKSTEREPGKISFEALQEALIEKSCTIKEAVVLFVALLRALGFQARFVWSLHPVPLRPSSIANTKTKSQKKEDKNINPKGPKNKAETKKDKNLDLKVPKNKGQMKKDKNLDIKGQMKKDKNRDIKGQMKKVKNLDPKSPKNNSEKKKDKNLDPKGPKNNSEMKKTRRGGPKPSTSRVVEASIEEEKPSNPNVDYWVDVYIESEEKWIVIDLFTGKVDCEKEICKRCTQPVLYIVGWNNDNTLKDVTRRYFPKWGLNLKKTRVKAEWWEESLHPFQGSQTMMDKREEERIEEDEEIIMRPMPSKIYEFKNHPLYALKRHLLKFEAIYPPDAVPLGFVRGEAVYSRYCIHELCSREKWLQQAKCVRVNEKPYKIVKSRAKPGTMLPGNEKPLELYGSWQVEDYMAPPAIDGKVPRNEYGNIEVYKPSMLPAGTVHLQIPGILKVARKLNIDCAPAVIGWEHHAGRSHPVVEGVVVCQEFQDILLDAWNAEIDTATQRTDHKRRQSAYKNWMKLTKYVIIKDNLKKKYKFGDIDDGHDSKNDNGEDGEEPPRKLIKK